jgi:uridylate kinase
MLLAGGTGHPFFTTDTTAALRAAELGAGALLKATKVDGVYSADPELDPTAIRIAELDYMEVVRRRYRVMDLTAITLCMEHQLPIIIFNLWETGNMRRVVAGEPVGTLIRTLTTAVEAADAS